MKQVLSHGSKGNSTMRKGTARQDKKEPNCLDNQDLVQSLTFLGVLRILQNQTALLGAATGDLNIHDSARAKCVEASEATATLIKKMYDLVEKGGGYEVVVGAGVHATV